MKNEEKARDLTKCVWYPEKCTEKDIQDMLLEMAEWKDEQFSIERKQLIEKSNQAVTQSFENGAIFKKQEMIKKACVFLENNIHDYFDGDNEFAVCDCFLTKENFIEQLKKVMEE